MHGEPYGRPGRSGCRAGGQHGYWTFFAAGGCFTPRTALFPYTTLFRSAATLDKVISGGDPYAAVGDVVSYGYTLTNTGNVTLSSVSVSDDTTDGAPLCH